MVVSSPDKLTVAFQTAYNARDKKALMRLYAHDATHTFDGATVSIGLDAISKAFDLGWARGTTLDGRTLSCIIVGDIALLRVRWRSLHLDGTVRSGIVSCEVAHKGADANWRCIIDDASGGSRPICE